MSGIDTSYIFDRYKCGFISIGLRAIAIYSTSEFQQFLDDLIPPE
jgi:hypothetical protein